MKQKQRVAFLGIAAVALIFAACDGDSGNNGTETDGTSSSSTPLSSSVGVESSSSPGTLTDARDGQTYKTVVIGTQTWMAENLNYDTLDGEGSWCPDNSETSCDQYGRLYDWATAMNISRAFNKSTWSGRQTNHQGLCPDHWRIPTDADWDTLISYATRFGYDSAPARRLKAVDGWDKTSLSITGTDDFGFAALPAGNLCSQDFDGQGASTAWYSASGREKKIVNDEKYFPNSCQTSSCRICAYSIRCIYGDSPAVAEDSSSDTKETASAAEKWCLVPGHCGMFRDYRDMTYYLWTKIGSQIWMSENLRYGIHDCFYSTCIDGYRYRWEDAMDGGDSTNAVPSGVRGVCPDGWHLPSSAEWDILAQFVDETNGTDGVGYSLKSTNYWDAYQDADGGGSDAFACTALGAGEEYGAFMYVDDYAWFLTASKTVRRLSYDSESLGESPYDNVSGDFSVRCVKD